MVYSISESCIIILCSLDFGSDSSDDDNSEGNSESAPDDIVESSGAGSDQEEVDMDKIVDTLLFRGNTSRFRSLDLLAQARVPPPPAAKALPPTAKAPPPAAKAPPPTAKAPPPAASNLKKTVIKPKVPLTSEAKRAKSDSGDSSSTAPASKSYGKSKSSSLSLAVPTGSRKSSSKSNTSSSSQSLVAPTTGGSKSSSKSKASSSSLLLGKKTDGKQSSSQSLTLSSTKTEVSVRRYSRSRRSGTLDSSSWFVPEEVSVATRRLAAKAKEEGGFSPRRLREAIVISSDSEEEVRERESERRTVGDKKRVIRRQGILSSCSSESEYDGKDVELTMESSDTATDRAVKANPIPELTKRKRGRPRKSPPNGAEIAPSAKRKRGRPKKENTVDVSVGSQGSSSSDSGHNAVVTQKEERPKSVAEVPDPSVPRHGYWSPNSSNSECEGRETVESSDGVKEDHNPELTRRKRGRGRPRKSPVETEMTTSTVKRKRGRPKKENDTEVADMSIMPVGEEGGARKRGQPNKQPDDDMDPGASHVYSYSSGEDDHDQFIETPGGRKFRHLEVARPTDPTPNVRRSKRARMPPVNPLLGQIAAYDRRRSGMCVLSY